MVALQNCMDLERNIPVSWRQTFPVFSHDANKFINIKVEAVSDVEVEEDPLLITFPQIKAEEHVVSSMSMFILLDFFSCLSKLHNCIMMNVF
jgi:hypothetical protein